MNRNSEYIASEKIIDPNHYGRKAQVGYDLSVSKIEKIKGVALFEGDSKLDRNYVQYEEAPTYKEHLEYLKNNWGDGFPSVDLIAKKYKTRNPDVQMSEADILNYMAQYYNLPPLSGREDYYFLEPNTRYVVEFDQGLIKLKENEWGYICQRSSAGRSGLLSGSSIWDPSFSTDQMGTTIHTGQIPVILPKHTRIAQMLIFDCEEVPKEDLYNGQWQNVANH